jgi:hypothetical protein
VKARHARDTNWRDLIVDDGRLTSEYVAAAAGTRTDRRFHPDTREWFAVVEGEVKVEIDRLVQISESSGLSPRGEAVTWSYLDTYRRESTLIEGMVGYDVGRATFATAQRRDRAGESTPSPVVPVRSSRRCPRARVREPYQPAPRAHDASAERGGDADCAWRQYVSARAIVFRGKPGHGLCRRAVGRWRGGERNASWCSSAGRCLARTRSRSRTREFAIRVALGADGRSVARLVLGHGVRITALGLVAGFVAVVLVAPLLRMLPVTVRPPDLFTIVPVALLIGAVAVGASLIPAWRASRANPMTALKAE